MVCGRGNAGQTNYGMANSEMERICERRRREGLPALAIQWGAIANVGLVAERKNQHNRAEIVGTCPQDISSCLATLDTLLRQNEPVVPSIVVSKGRSSKEVYNIVDCVADIMGKLAKLVAFQSII